MHQRVEGGYVLPEYDSSFSLARIPDRNYDFYTELTNVCLEERDKGLSEKQKFLTMHPLKYSGDGTADSDELYWPQLGVKDNFGNNLFGMPTFAPIEESSSFNKPNRTIYFHGKTLFPQCFWHSNSPGHWIFAMSAIFELARKLPTIFPEFDRLALLKCASWQHVLREWEWGQLTLESALDPLVQKKLIRSYLYEKSSANISSWPSSAEKHVSYPLAHIFSPIRDPNFQPPPVLLCFESLHVISRWGITSNSTEDVNAFRKTVMKTKLKRNPNSPTDLLMNPLINDATINDRCQEKSLRVAIYLRPKKLPRNLVNEAEIVDIIRKHTSEVTTKRIWAPSMDEQLEMYNAFDILISPPGSHLVNLIFTNRTRVAVIEIGLAIRDAFWRENALRIGIDNYYYSMAGSDGDDKCYKENKMDKNCRVQADGQTVICPLGKKQQWHPVGDCSFTLNATVFEKQFVNAIRSLCGKY